MLSVLTSSFTSAVLLYIQYINVCIHGMLYLSYYCAILLCVCASVAFCDESIIANKA